MPIGQENRIAAIYRFVLENDLIIDNFYIPAGGDLPDPANNDKFAHKLQFLDELADWSAHRDHGRPSVLVGDLNIAPREAMSGHINNC